MASGANEPLDKRKTIGAMKEEFLGDGDKPDYATVKGTVNYIKRDNDPWYLACPTVGCSKKVTEGPSGYTCEKCNQNFPEVSHISQYLISSF